MIHLGKRLELFYLSFVPPIITFALAIFFMAAKHIDGLDRVMPILPAIPIFYWGLAQARDMPYWFVFILGVVIDAISGLPLGLTSLTYIFMLLVLRSQRKYIHKEGFVLKLGFFALTLAVTDLVNWGMLSLYYSQFQPGGASMIQWFLTVCCYPLLHKWFDHIHEQLMSRRWRILHGH